MVGYLANASDIGPNSIVPPCVSDSHVFPIVYFSRVSFLQNDVIFLITSDTGRTKSPFIFIFIYIKVMLCEIIKITPLLKRLIQKSSFYYNYLT